MSDWVPVARVGDVKPGQVIQVEVDEEPVAVANVDGEIRAFSDVCTHEYVMLSEGWLEGDEIECPQHGSRFDTRTGEVSGPPATQPLPIYEVKLEDSQIYVKGPWNLDD